MKKPITPVALFALPLAIMFLLLSSFFSNPGGEGFEVLKNNKLVLQQFGADMKNIKTLQVENASAGDEYTIKYYHCGKVGKNRRLIFRSSDNRELKSSQFSSMISSDPGMSFHPADVFMVKGKKAVNTVNIYYTSSEIPSERLLLILQLKN